MVFSPPRITLPKESRVENSYSGAHGLGVEQMRHRLCPPGGLLIAGSYGNMCSEQWVLSHTSWATLVTGVCAFIPWSGQPVFKEEGEGVVGASRVQRKGMRESFGMDWNRLKAKARDREGVRVEAWIEEALGSQYPWEVRAAPPARELRSDGL